MILYLKPPPVLIDLRKFNECCSSRLQFFISTTDEEKLNDSFPESITPGTKLDSVGHFVLRCFCLYEPAAQDFIMEKELRLFQYRLKQYSENSYLMKDACKTVLKDIRKLRTYQEMNPLTCVKEQPYLGSMLQTTLSCISKLLIQNDVSHHFRLDCHANCHEVEIEIPFQMCLTLVSSRSVSMKNGSVVVPCSLWNELLMELFQHHYTFGLSMISHTIQFNKDLDVRWMETFERLNFMYQSFVMIKKSLPDQRLTAKMVDSEARYFPPCMSHLLSILRSHHRLTYAWRYRFSLFLKDIGLNVDESIQFWKTEYTKSCSTSSACKHSWKENQRKYTYSIRHMYGLEGSRIIGRSKSCHRIQDMQLGMRDEGGCPFVHFDEAHLLQSLSHTVRKNADIIQTILQLKAAGKPNEACNLHMLTAFEGLRKNGASQISIEYESPLEYYFNFKRYACGFFSW